jgi:hypothetical protein
MADYPSGIYAPRTKTNKSGVVYDAAKSTIGYAEDVTKLDAEVVAIETELGANPKDGSASVAARFTADESEISGKQAALGFTPENIANKSIDGTLADNSDTEYPSQKAVKTYADTKVPKTTTVNGHALSGNISVTTTDLSLQNVDNTSDATKNTATATLTNKRITKRIGTVADSATPTPDADAHDDYHVTALAQAATFGAPSGTPTDGQRLLIRIKDNATARALSWNAIYRAGTDVALPTTTVLSKTLYCGFMYNNAESKWDLVAVTNNI